MLFSYFSSFNSISSSRFHGCSYSVSFLVLVQLLPFILLFVFLFVFLIPSVAPVRSRPFKIDTEAIGIVRILKTISFLQSTRTGGRAGFLICYCFLSSEQGKVYKGIDYLTRPVHPLKLGTL